jgi:hypothetical protein
MIDSVHLPKMPVHAPYRQIIVQCSDTAVMLRSLISELMQVLHVVTIRVTDFQRVWTLLQNASLRFRLQRQSVFNLSIIMRFSLQTVSIHFT